MKNIILLNGPSSSGKSTLSKALQSYFANIGKKYNIISIDGFMKISTSETIYEDDVYEISLDMCKAILDSLKNNEGVIVDHVITSPRIFNQFIDTTNDYSHLLVHVTCPLDVLLQREKSRGNRHKGSAKDSYDYLYPKDGYDVTVDTHSMSLDECIKIIINKI